MRTLRAQASLAVLPIACALFIVAVYFPDLGRGFVKDDFTWIRAARAAIAHPVTLIRQPDAGFYRPVVTIAFAFDYVMHGWTPRGYGWTNLALVLSCAAALAVLAMTLGVSARAALVAAVLWTINPHGINMAILWLSGRTATLLTLFSLLAAVAFLRRWYLLAAALIALALGSKEEAVVLPFILLAWTWIRGEGEWRSWRAIAALLVPLAVYCSLRALTPAMTPATAPAFYRFTLDPRLVTANLGQYLDRSATLAAAALVCALLVYRRRPRLSPSDRPLVAMLVAWWAGMFAITIWLPVRSSLYAVCPSIAAAILSAMLIDRMREASASRLPLEPVLALLVVASIPIYQMRDDLRAEGARVSQRTLHEIAHDLPALPASGVIVLHEDPAAPVFAEAFGDLPAEALRTRFDREWDARIVSDPQPVRSSSAPSDVIAEYWIRNGTIERAARR
jgi:hypothetical protein